MKISVHTIILWMIEFEFSFHGQPEDEEMIVVTISQIMEKMIAFLVGHHHTFTDIDNVDYQILIEADYIANASENGYSEENIRNFTQKIMKTPSGKKLLQDVFSNSDLHCC